MLTQKTLTRTLAALLLSAGCHTALAAKVTGKNADADCAIPDKADYTELPEIAALPDPFIAANGERIGRHEQWPCQRAYLSAQLQRWVYGEKPEFESQVNPEVNAQSITVEVQKDNRQIAYTAEVTLPEQGSPPYPAIIGIGRSFLDNRALLEQGVALVNFPNDELGQQQGLHSRGKGKFYALFGEDHSAASTIAWAWGVSRVIDALAASEGHGIDVQRLGVTGCSRNGKGALVTGALDERIALTIVQESGSGGSAAWRVSDAQLASGQNVQTARQIVTENTWLREDFAQFSESIAKLPVDNHALMGLMAPRGLLLLENTGMEWLGNKSAYTSALAAREIYKALGKADHMGITQVGGHQHCVVPDSQKPAITRFVSRFLLGEDVNTDLVETDGEFNVDRGHWMPWPTPALRESSGGE